jgi:hypothetical protein
MIKRRLIQTKRKQPKQKITARNVDISTEGTVNINLSVNLHTQQKFAKPISKGRNVTKMCVE